MNLPDRLQAIADMIPDGSVTADIGTDHALLPIYLIQSGRASKVTAGDLNEGPLEAARENILVKGLNDRISLKLGFGLDIVDPDTEVVVIAGMGGTTIRNIIDRDGPNTKQIKKFVLQPMSGEGDLRLWLTEHGWRIDDENLVCEDGRIYHIISAVRGQEKTSDKDIISIGPRLFEKNHPLLKETILAEIRHNKHIMANLARSAKAGAAVKKEQLQQRNRQLERIIGCLSNVKQ